MFGPLNVFRSLPEASSTHSATAQQSPQGSSMKGLCAVVGIGTTAVLHSVLIKFSMYTNCWLERQNDIIFTRTAKCTVFNGTVPFFGSMYRLYVTRQKMYRLKRFLNNNFSLISR